MLLGLLVGAALGVSGAVMQSVFGNPLAEPSVIGISAGAAVGDCFAIVFMLAFLGVFTVPVFAFVCTLRVLLPASALGGALLIACSNLAARTLVPFADLPIGIFTALVGGPTFFVLLRRTMQKGA